MKQIGSVFSFEWNKFRKDLPRIILFGVIFASIILVTFYFVFMRMGTNTYCSGESYSLEWTAEIEVQYKERMDYYYLNYLIAMGKENPPEGGFIILPPELSLKEYLYYKTLLETKVPYTISGFSEPGNYLFPTHSVGFSDYPFLPSFRMFMYQDIAYVLMPVLFWVEIFFVFRYDGFLKTDKVIASMGIKRKDLLLGKVLHCLVVCFSSMLVFCLFGLIFYQNVPFAFYNGEAWHITNTIAVYFERWLEMGLSLFAMISLMMVLAIIIPSGVAYLILGGALSLSFTPAIHFIQWSLQTDSGFPELYDIPFINLIASDGFADPNASLKYPIILLSLLGCWLLIGCAILVAHLKDRRFTLRYKKPSISH